MQIIQYWHSEKIPQDIAQLISTFRSCNPGAAHSLFCEADAAEFIATHFTSRELAAFKACAVPAMQADYFRYCAVLALGGVYADVDFRCRRSLSTLIDTTDDGVLFRGAHGPVINSFFAFNAPAHPLLRLTIDIATVNIERKVSERVDVVTGPWIFTLLATLHNDRTPERAYCWASRRGLGPAAELMMETIGDASGIGQAFGGVRIAPRTMAYRWIAKPAIQLQHKQHETDWVTWGKSGRTIFR